MIADLQTDQGEPQGEMSGFAALLRQSRYTLSEQAVRAVAEGKISVLDVESALLTGRVLEERRNPMRVPCYLVLGESGGKPVHVVCADGLNGELAILFAYVPELPLWLSPTRRNAFGALLGDDMTQSVGNCFFCGGDLVEIVVGNYYYRREGRMCVVKSLPATLCQQCDEKYLRAEVAKRLNALIDEGKFTGVEEARVVDYSPEAIEP